MKILVVGDCHVDEKQALDRFYLANAFIKDHKPDIVVIIGDFLSMNCLSDWDKNKRKTMEGLRYKLEIDAGNKALDMMFDGTSNTRVYFMEGNHENRLTRYLDTDPVFEGTVSVELDLHLSSRGITFIPYKDTLELEGISFCHIPIASSGKPIGNPTVAQKALRLFNGSVVFGHTHTLDVACEHRHGAAHLAQAVSAGCFFEHIDEYAQGSKTDYWRGLILLDTYKPGRFDIHTYALGNLERTYGKRKGNQANTSTQVPAQKRKGTKPSSKRKKTNARGVQGK